MDLETLIPFIIVAAAYLFKAFENARKKKPGKPRPAAPGTPARPVTRNTPERQIPRGNETVAGNEAQYRPAYTEDPATPRPPMQWELPEEVLRSREDRQRRIQNRETPLQVLAETDEEQEEVEFDLREAVIQSAILERKEL